MHNVLFTVPSSFDGRAPDLKCVLEKYVLMCFRFYLTKDHIDNKINFTLLNNSNKIYISILSTLHQVRTLEQ